MTKKTSDGAKRAAKKAVKKAAKSKGFLIALTVVVVMAVLALLVTYIVKPELIMNAVNAIVDYFKDDKGEGQQPEGVLPLEGARLDVRILDVGQGDCIFVTFPDGKTMVMDVGSAVGTVSPWATLDAALKKEGVTTLDYLFLTHTDYDHIREAKKLIDNYEIKEFHLPVTGPPPDTAKPDMVTWRKILAAAEEETYSEGGAQKKAVVNDNVGTFEIAGEGWEMKCRSYEAEDYPVLNGDASATDLNAVSPICVLSYAGREVVFTGDSNFENEAYLLAKDSFAGVDADVLKVAHHGSETSTSQEFLDAIDAEYAVISVGAGNTYDHPKKSLLERLDAYIDVEKDGDYVGFARVFRTDTDGSIVVSVDESGTMNIISSSDEGKNVGVEKTAFVAIASNMRVNVYVYERKYARV